MDKQLRVLMIGAHPDDCDFSAGGTAVKYARLGHKVKFISVCNGCCGHHEMTCEKTAKRRKGETSAVAKTAGIEYDVWDINDCEAEATLENRKKMIREIRKFRPDIIFTCRNNDYHADHRNTALLVQDASYLLIVPHFCEDVPALSEMPVIMNFYDRFKNPPFVPEIIVDIDDAIDKKFEIMDCHVSQVYEWLPYSKSAPMPSADEDRLAWLKGEKVPRDRVLSLDEIMSANYTNGHCEYREAQCAARYRDKLIERYGEKGKKVIFAECFGISEYGTQLDEENKKVLFPF